MYKNGTSSQGFFAFLLLPYMALHCDRCLVITTFYNLFAPFHGGNTGSNPVGGAKPITYRRNVYSLLNKRIGNRCSRETSPRKPTQWIRHTPGTQAGHLHTEPLVLIGSWSSGSWYRSRLIGSEPPVILLAAFWTQRVRPQLTLSI